MPTKNMERALSVLNAAGAEGQLSTSAVANIRTWLTEPYLEEYAPQVAERLLAGNFKELDDAFWTIIPFGTGGRRGWMYPVGSNAINDRTIGESAQGLADYVKEHIHEVHRSCVIAYDTRHRSRRFAELCAEIMVAAGFTVYFLDGYRSTPEMSFSVRHKNCACGLMITASHNPPKDNAVKVYGPSGGQLLPPHDSGSIDYMKRVTYIRRVAFSEGVNSGKIILAQDELDKAYIEAVETQAIAGPRELKIIYSPLHGVGTSAVLPALEADGFTDVELFGPHAEPDPDFPNVPGNSSNPENSAVFDIIIERGKEIGADLIMATDPDCDRLGCAAPVSTAAASEWQTITGNQIGALLADYLLGTRQAAGTLTPEHYVVKTLVTSELIRRVADNYGVRTEGNLLVGFKWIGGKIDECGPDEFVFGAEESYGFLVGQYARDKDGAVAAMLLAELAARLKAEGRTLVEQLDALFAQYGCHAERTISIQMPGEKGMDDMRRLMARFRAEPPRALGGIDVVRRRDYLNQTVTETGGEAQPLKCPKGDMVIFDLAAEGNYVAVRPSGTEPKVKFYMFAYDTPQASADLAATKANQAERLSAMEADIRAFAGEG